MIPNIQASETTRVEPPRREYDQLLTTTSRVVYSDGKLRAAGSRQTRDLSAMGRLASYCDCRCLEQ